MANQDVDKDAFSCHICTMSLKYDYHGRNPPFVHHFKMKEDSYVMKDPFVDGKRCIVLGGTCAVCRKQVCVSADCSIFYSKRFCFECLDEKLHLFPGAIQKEVKKRKENQTT